MRRSRWEEKLHSALLSFFFLSLCLSVALQQTALGLLLALLAYVGWQHGGLPATPLTRSLLGFFAALLLSTFLSPDILNSLGGYRKLWLVGAFFGTYHLVREPQEAWRLVSLLMRVAAVVAAYGIVQHFTGIDWGREVLGKEPDLDPFWFGRQEGFRTEGLFPSGITYAHNLVFPLTFVTVLLFAPELRWRKGVVMLCGWSLMMFALLFSLTRGVWLAYACVLLLGGVIRGRRTLLRAAGGAVVFGIFLLSAGAGVRERATEVFDLNAAANFGRSHIWQANLAMIAERPLVGWGYGNYKKFRDPYYQRYPQVDTTAHAHNNFLQIWVDGGLLALGAFLVVCGMILKKGWQAYRRLSTEPAKSLALGGVLGVVGFLLGGLTQYNFGDAEVVILFWTTTGLLMRLHDWALASRP